MNKAAIATIVLATSLFSGACATKKYVAKSIDPVNNRLDQVSQKSDEQGRKLDTTASSLDATRQNLEKDETELSATKERAMSADNRAGDALNRAGEANQKADQASRDISDLKGVVANLDDYKPVGQAVVNFKFNSEKLDTDAKLALDQMVSGQTQSKRFFIAVEGYTDRVGTETYNAALSRRRADAVVAYLVAQHNIPVYRIHMVGLGKMKPVDEDKTRAAQAKNRRVEVTYFTADSNMSMSSARAGTN
jgi:outer membrane protein OmpA-like peptidoglycan-associated protein